MRILCQYTVELEARRYPIRALTKLLLYTYAVGVPSCRKIAQRCEEDLAVRVLTSNQTLDFRTISDFRQRHVEALPHLFVQVLQVCQRADFSGLPRVGRKTWRFQCVNGFLSFASWKEPARPERPTC